MKNTLKRIWKVYKLVCNISLVLTEIAYGGVMIRRMIDGIKDTQEAIKMWANPAMYYFDWFKEDLLLGFGIGILKDSNESEESD